MLLLFHLRGNERAWFVGVFCTYIYSVRIFMKITWPLLERSLLFVKYKSICNLSLIETIVNVKESVSVYGMCNIEFAKICKKL